jgi:predicted small lipoprotein YifL
MIRALLLAALAVALLAGCGYKAPLYLPTPKAEGPKAPAIVLPEPAPDRPVPSDAAPPPK